MGLDRGGIPAPVGSSLMAWGRTIALFRIHGPLPRKDMPQTLGIRKIGQGDRALIDQERLPIDEACSLSPYLS